MKTTRTLTELTEYAFEHPPAPVRLFDRDAHRWWKFCRLWARLALEHWAATTPSGRLVRRSPPPGVPMIPVAPAVHLLHPTADVAVCALFRRPHVKPGDSYARTLAEVTCKECLS